MDKPDIEKMKANKDVEGLIEALKHEWASIREKAIEVLGEIRDERAGFGVIWHLSHAQRLIRRNNGE